jgi:cytochrome P450
MKWPADVSTSLIPYLISLEYPEYSKHGYFYLDMWPIVNSMIVVSNPDMMVSFTQDVSLPKHRQMPFEFGPFSHGLDLVTSNGPVWKTWRAIFNPAFSLKNIQTYVPIMLQEFNIFRSKLATTASNGNVVNMDKVTMALTVDIIGHAVLYGTSI